MASSHFLQVFLARLECLEVRWAKLEERVAVMEENTCDHETRLEELEEWKEEADDILDCY